jgi:ribosomal protein L7Ae-like RNA K-turn-binding protein
MDKILNLLGLACKARKLRLGFTATSVAVKKGEIQMVIMAKDSSPHTREKIERLCKQYRVDIYYIADQAKLGQALGKHSQTVVGISSRDMALAIKALME